MQDKIETSKTNDTSYNEIVQLYETIMMETEDSSPTNVEFQDVEPDEQEQEFIAIYKMRKVAKSNEIESDATTLQQVYNSNVPTDVQYASARDLENLVTDYQTISGINSSFFNSNDLENLKPEQVESTEYATDSNISEISDLSDLPSCFESDAIIKKLRQFCLKNAFGLVCETWDIYNVTLPVIMDLTFILITIIPLHIMAGIRFISNIFSNALCNNEIDIKTSEEEQLNNNFVVGYSL